MAHLMMRYQKAVKLLQLLMKLVKPWVLIGLSGPSWLKQFHQPILNIWGYNYMNGFDESWQEVDDLRITTCRLTCGFIN